VVELVRRDGRLRIRVSDDGRGFDMRRESEGFGLRGMRERVELLDGRLTLALREEGGTEVVATLPLPGQL
jgi:signal transduction histidine kinase